VARLEGGEVSLLRRRKARHEMSRHSGANSCEDYMPEITD